MMVGRDQGGAGESVKGVSAAHRAVWIFLKPGSEALGVVFVRTLQPDDGAALGNFTVADTALLGLISHVFLHLADGIGGEWIRVVLRVHFCQ